MDIGNRIKFFRLKKGITVNRLANLSGISQSYLRDLELGKKQPTVEYLSYICDALGVSLKRFFTDEKEENELLEAAEKLNELQREALLYFIRTLTEEM